MLRHTFRKGVIECGEEQSKRTRVGSPARGIGKIRKGERRGSRGAVGRSRKLQERWPLDGVGNGAEGSLNGIGIVDPTNFF